MGPESEGSKTRNQRRLQKGVEKKVRVENRREREKLLEKNFKIAAIQRGVMVFIVQV